MPIFGIPSGPLSIAMHLVSCRHASPYPARRLRTPCSQHHRCCRVKPHEGERGQFAGRAGGRSAAANPSFKALRGSLAELLSINAIVAKKYESERKGRYPVLQKTKDSKRSKVEIENVC